MKASIRTVVLGLLLASGATAVHAQAKAPEATPPVDPSASQQPAPINLSLPPAAPPSSFQADPLLPSQADPLTTPIVPAPAKVTTAAATPTAPAPAPAAPSSSLPVDALQNASAEIKAVARWVVDSRDNAGLPFLLIDKVNARVFAFNPAGQLQSDAPVLLGMSKGDRLVAPNSAMMAQMGPDERITPAGRFVSRLAIDSHGKELLVLDYQASISLHPVVKGTPKEHRAERLNSPTAQDNRISFGCINAPAAFYSNFVSPAFKGTKGIVYVLPETSSATAFFGMPAVGAVVSAPLPGPTSLDASAATASPGAQN